MTDPRHHGHSSRTGQQYIRWSIYWSSGYDGVEPSKAGANTCRMVQWHRRAFRTGMVQRTVVAFRSVRQDATTTGAVRKLRDFCVRFVRIGLALTFQWLGADGMADGIETDALSTVRIRLKASPCCRCRSANSRTIRTMRTQKS